MKTNTIITIITLTTFLSGCFETPEQQKVRETQFNGKTVSEISAIIGKPAAQDNSKAVWLHKGQYINRIPIQSFINGKWVTTGYRNERVNVNCTYTAILRNGRVISNIYDGNNCERFAPKIK